MISKSFSNLLLLISYKLRQRIAAKIKDEFKDECAQKLNNDDIKPIYNYSYNNLNYLCYKFGESDYQKLKDLCTPKDNTSACVAWCITQNNDHYYKKYIDKNPEGKKNYFIIFKTTIQNSKIVKAQPFIMIILTSLYNDINYQVRNIYNKFYTEQNTAIKNILQKIKDEYSDNLKDELDFQNEETNGTNQLDKYLTISETANIDTIDSYEQDGYTIEKKKNGGIIIYSKQKINKPIILLNEDISITGKGINGNDYQIIKQIINNNNKFYDSIFASLQNDFLTVQAAEKLINQLIINKKWYHLSQLLINETITRSMRLAKELKPMLNETILKSFTKKDSDAPKAYLIKLLNIKNQYIRNEILNSQEDLKTKELLLTISKAYESVESNVDNDLLEDPMYNKLDKFNNMINKLLSFKDTESNISPNKINQSIQLVENILSLYTNFSQDNNKQIRQNSTNIKSQLSRIFKIWFGNFNSLLKNKQLLEKNKSSIEQFFNFLQKNLNVWKNLVGIGAKQTEIADFFIWCSNTENTKDLKFTNKTKFRQRGIAIRNNRNETLGKSYQTTDTYFKLLNKIFSKIFDPQSLQNCIQKLNVAYNHIINDDVKKALIDKQSIFEETINTYFEEIYNMSITEKDKELIFDSLSMCLDVDLINIQNLTFQSIGNIKKIFNNAIKDIKKVIQTINDDKEKKVLSDVKKVIENQFTEFNNVQHNTSKIISNTNIEELKKQLKFNVSDNFLARKNDEIQNYFITFAKISKQSSHTSLLLSESSGISGLTRNNIVGTIYGICIEKIRQKYRELNGQETDSESLTLNQEVQNKFFNNLIDLSNKKFTENNKSNILTLFNYNGFVDIKNNMKINQEILDAITKIINKLLTIKQKTELDNKLLTTIQYAIRKPDNPILKNLWQQLYNYINSKLNTKFSLNSINDQNMDEIFDHLDIYIKNNKSQLKQQQKYRKILSDLAQWIGIDISTINERTNKDDIKRLFTKSEKFQELDTRYRTSIFSLIDLYFNSTAVLTFDQSFRGHNVVDSIINSNSVEEIRNAFVEYFKNKATLPVLKDIFTYAFLKLINNSNDFQKLQNHKYRFCRYGDTISKENILDIMIDSFKQYATTSQKIKILNDMLKSCEKFKDIMFDQKGNQIRFIKANKKHYFRRYRLK